MAAFVRVMLQLPEPSPVSGSPTSLQSEPFDLRCCTTTVSCAPFAFLLKVCASDGRFFVSMKRGSVAVVMIFQTPTGVTDGRLVDQRDLDLVGADHARVDVRVRAGADRGVEVRDELVDRTVGAESFSISIRPTMSAFIAFSALTSLAFWRLNSNSVFAPREVGKPPAAPSRPEPLPLKKFRTLNDATLRFPPTGGGAAVRGFVWLNEIGPTGWIR